MENKQQALGEIQNNGVYELVGIAEARWADSYQCFECQQRQSAQIGRDMVVGCSCFLTGGVDAMGSNDVLFSQRNFDLVDQKK